MGRALIPSLVYTCNSVISNYLTRLLEQEKHSASELYTGGLCSKIQGPVCDYFPSEMLLRSSSSANFISIQVNDQGSTSKNVLQIILFHSVKAARHVGEKNETKYHLVPNIPVSQVEISYKSEIMLPKKVFCC